MSGRGHMGSGGLTPGHDPDPGRGVRGSPPRGVTPDPRGDTTRSGGRAKRDDPPAVWVRVLMCAVHRLPREQPGTAWDSTPLAGLPHPPCVFCGIPAATLMDMFREHREKAK